MLARRKLLRSALIALPTASMVRRPAFATAGVPTDIDQPQAVARAAVEALPQDGTLDERMEAFVANSGFGDREAKNQLFVLKGTAPVQVSTADPSWVQYRTLAYKDALLEAQAAFVASQYTEVMTRTVKEFYKGNDEPPPYVDTKVPGQAAEVIRKVLAVAGGRLDQQLQELGIDPQQYASTPEPQRAPLLTNHLKTSSLSHALGPMAGLCPVMTFEEWRNGQGRIGVVAITSQAMTDFARQVLTARGEFTPDPARAQDLSKLIADKTQLLSDFGVRRTYDAQGLPAIVSFGQWGSAYHGTDAAMAANYYDTAVHQAETIANDQIAEFLGGSVDYRTNSTIGQEIDHIGVSLPDHSSIDDTKHVVDELKRLIVRSAHVKVSGTRTLSTWTGRHPAADLPVIGVVKIWSAAGELAMRRQQAPKPSESKQAEKSGQLEGRRLMDPSDF